MDTILFLDTCILLDFYRTGGRQDALSGLRHIAENHRRIVTTAQVAMDFSKNRQGVLLRASKFTEASGGDRSRLSGVLAVEVPKAARTAAAKFQR